MGAKVLRGWRWHPHHFKRGKSPACLRTCETSTNSLCCNAKKERVLLYIALGEVDRLTTKPVLKGNMHARMRAPTHKRTNKLFVYPAPFVIDVDLEPVDAEVPGAQVKETEQDETK